ncbi:MAG: hypothetical protein OFPII_39790 [Osedax symbiont Rs1]|nr:MAG: hypothetical protein OFPII_39790 [Osedax symbiont Rs1]
MGLMIELAAKLPYWASLLIAIIGYVVLHSIAASELEPVIVEQGKAPMPNITGMVFIGAATAFQYIIPMMFIFGAIIKAIKAAQGKNLAQRYVVSNLENSSHNDSKPTDEMNWQQFELLVGQAFRGKGYSVVDGGDLGADGGVDVHLSKDGLKYFVQCKHWKTRKVGVAVVRELYGVIAGAGVEGGFVVASGGFARDAIDFAENKQIELVDQHGLNTMLKGRQEPAITPSVEETVSSFEESNCPKCNSTMVKRKARQGVRAEQEFWGCSSYPKCRGIVNI